MDLSSFCFELNVLNESKYSAMPLVRCAFGNVFDSWQEEPGGMEEWRVWEILFKQEHLYPVPCELWAAGGLGRVEL